MKKLVILFVFLVVTLTSFAQQRELSKAEIFKNRASFMEVEEIKLGSISFWFFGVHKNVYVSFATFTNLMDSTKYNAVQLESYYNIDKTFFSRYNYIEIDELDNVIKALGNMAVRVKTDKKVNRTMVYYTTVNKISIWFTGKDDSYTPFISVDKYDSDTTQEMSVEDLINLRNYLITAKSLIKK